MKNIVFLFLVMTLGACVERNPPSLPDDNVGEGEGEGEEGEGEGEGEEPLPTVTVTVTRPFSFVSRQAVKGTPDVPTVSFTLETPVDLSVAGLEIPIAGAADGHWDGERDIPIADHVRSCALRNDETKELVFGATAPTTNGFIRFIDATTLPAGVTSVVLECSFLQVDQVPTGAQFDFKFDAYAAVLGDLTIAATNAVVEVELVDPLEPADAPVVRILNKGQIYSRFDFDPDLPPSALLVSITPGEHIGTFSLTSELEDVTVTELSLHNCLTRSPDFDGTCQATVPGVDEVAVAVRIVFKDGGDYVTFTGFLVNGTVTFNGFTLRAKPDWSHQFDVFIDTNTVSASAARSGDRIQLNLDMAYRPFRAVGQTSGETFTQEDVSQYMLAKPMVIRKTKPTLNLASDSPSGTAVPGPLDTLHYIWSCNSRGFCTQNSTLFAVESTDVDGSDWNTCGSLGFPQKWALIDRDDPSELLDDNGDWAFLNNAGEPCSAGETLAYVRLDLDADTTHPIEEVGAGATKTYALRTDATGASTGDTLRIRISSEEEAQDLASPQHAIRWNDDVEAENIDGSLLQTEVVGNALDF